METITMTLVNQPELFLECYSVTPDMFAGKSLAEIGAIFAQELSSTKARIKLMVIMGITDCRDDIERLFRLTLKGV